MFRSEVLVPFVTSQSVDLSGSPVWLEGDFVVSGHLTKILLQLSEELLVTFCLVQRHKGVNVGKLLPGDWLQEQRNVFFFFFSDFHR